MILGVDPGTRVTGYGLLRTDGCRYEVVDCGTIRPPATLPLFERQLIIHREVVGLVDRFAVDVMAVEGQYVSKNPQAALKLGMAKGVAVLAGTRRGIPVFEYAPSQAKVAITGRGNATKQEVGRTARMLLSLETIPSPQDAADALAIALCHAHRMRRSVRDV